MTESWRLTGSRGSLQHARGFDDDTPHRRSATLLHLVDSIFSSNREDGCQSIQSRIAWRQRGKVSLKPAVTKWSESTNTCASRVQVRARTLVRLAFKSFELNIPFDDKDPSGVPINAQHEPVYKTHVDKINKMKDWKDSPFRHKSIQQKSNGFMLKLLATKVDCEKCTTGHANKQCKKLLCKKCCLDDETTTKCAAHRKAVAT